ncbi:MAG: NAD-dependent epimerase/dehydratase family protein [Methanocellales archaeon]
MDMQRVLITGGMGQVGSYIAEELSREYEVVVLDNFTSNAINKLPNEITIIKGDVRDPKILKLFKDILDLELDIIIHCAAQISVTKSLQNPVYDFKVNAAGTLNLLNVAKKLNISRFIYFSSAAVYGMPRYLPIDEEHPLNPISPYGASKLAGEKYCHVFNHVYGLPVVCLRPFNIYSPRQRAENPYSGVICRFIDRVKKGKPPVIEGDGTQTRDFISIHDVVRFVLLAMKKQRAIGEVYNVGTGKPTMIKALAAEIIEIVGRKLKPVHAKPREGDIKQSYADIRKAKALGFKLKVNLSEGLMELIQNAS